VDQFPKLFAHKGLRLRVFPEKNVFVKGIPLQKNCDGTMDFAQSGSEMATVDDG
jgi:hypothetical protein